MSVPPIVTKRLDLVAADPEQFDALLAHDPGAFSASLGAPAPVPFEPPPLTDDVIEWFRDQLRADSGIKPWLFRWMISRPDRSVIGSLGFAGPPDADGVVVMGYSVYPQFERRGYASEAASALIEWALTQPGVRTVRATIKPDNVASRRVATHAGLVLAGQTHSDEEGLLDVWERYAPR